MKHLGLTLDIHCEFDVLFERLAPLVEATANALGHLLPRLDGPGVGVRRLFARVVRSKLLYVAPIWAAELMANRRSLQLVRRLHRTVATRIVRGYRMTSTVAAGLLEGLPPFELQATRCREMFFHARRLSTGIGPANAEVGAQARRTLLDTWRASLDTRTGALGLRVLEAVLPNWDVWLDGNGSPLTYRVTQVLTEHGCFGECLRRIGMEATAWCHHCDEGVDSARHTLKHCRRGLLRATLSPPSWDGTSLHQQCSKHCCQARAVGERSPLSASK
jgi:hypothetical protein